MSYLTFIVIAHVDDNCVRFVGQAIELEGVHVRSGLGYVERAVVQTVSQDLFLADDFKLEKRFAVVVYSKVEPDTGQKGDTIDIVAEIRFPAVRDAYLRVYALGSDIHPAEGFQGRKANIKLIPPVRRIIDTGILVKGKGRTVLPRRMQLFRQNTAVYAVV